MNLFNIFSRLKKNVEAGIIKNLEGITFIDNPGKISAMYNGMEIGFLEYNVFERIKNINVAMVSVQSEFRDTQAFRGLLKRFYAVYQQYDTITVDDEGKNQHMWSISAQFANPYLDDAFKEWDKRGLIKRNPYTKSLKGKDKYKKYDEWQKEQDKRYDKNRSQQDNLPELFLNAKNPDNKDPLDIGAIFINLTQDQINQLNQINIDKNQSPRIKNCAITSGNFYYSYDFETLRNLPDISGFTILISTENNSTSYIINNINNYNDISNYFYMGPILGSTTNTFIVSYPSYNGDFVNEQFNNLDEWLLFAQGLINNPQIAFSRLKRKKEG